MGAGFQLDQRARFLPPDKAVKLPPVQGHAVMIGQRRVFATASGGQAGAVQTERLRQRVAQRRRFIAQQIGRIGTQVRHNAKAIQRDQHAVRLNRAGRVKLGLRFEWHVVGPWPDRALSPRRERRGVAARPM